MVTSRQLEIQAHQITQGFFTQALTDLKTRGNVSVFFSSIGSCLLNGTTVWLSLSNQRGRDKPVFALFPVLPPSPTLYDGLLIETELPPEKIKLIETADFKSKQTTKFPQQQLSSFCCETDLFVSKGW